MMAAGPHSTASNASRFSQNPVSSLFSLLKPTNATGATPWRPGPSFIHVHVLCSSHLMMALPDIAPSLPHARLNPTSRVRLLPTGRWQWPGAHMSTENQLKLRPLTPEPEREIPELVWKFSPWTSRSWKHRQICFRCD